ncbi:MAG: ribonuclease PH [Acidimicrobiia bacterium]|nr:ribonuclease PH [Acidimicrobiia bacterium]
MRERPKDEIRAVRVETGWTDTTPGSVLISMGKTRVLCTASVEDDVPRWMRGSGKGWVTAEYAMLPGSSNDRIHRGHIEGGRAKEISRLIGRALRAVVNMSALGERMVRVDCDVLQADGGTRTAAITGAWIALHDALDSVGATSAIIDKVAAISAGIVDGEVLLDLEYESDVAAEVDMNVVMSGRGLLVEVQGTAEGAPFTREDLDTMLELAASGITDLVEMQERATASQE